MKRVYLETNYLIGQVFQQDIDAAQLLATATAVGAEVCLPFNCIHESLVHIERIYLKRNKQLDEMLRLEINQLRTDQSQSAVQLVATLSRAKLEIDKLSNERQNRFVSILGTLAHVRFVQMDPASVLQAVQNRIISAAADNLILAAVIDDARMHPGDDMVFFTRNTNDFDVPACHAALQQVGVQLMTTAGAVLTWLGTP